jgi:hypothetical protein
MSSNYISLYNESNITADNITVDGTIDLSNATVIIGNIAFPDGLVNAPSITFKNDLQTGFYRPGPIGEVHFTSNGNDMAIFRPSGLVINGTILGSSNIAATGLLSGAGVYTTNGLQSISGNVQVSGGSVILLDHQFRGPTGTNSAPTYSFYSDGGTGMYYSNTSEITICGNSTSLITLNPSQVQIFRPLSMGTNSINCGPLTSTGNISCSNILSSPYLYITSDAQIVGSVQIGSGPIYNASGTASAPSYTFQGDNTVGIYQNGAETLSISSNGTEVFRVNFSQIQMFANLSMGTNTINSGNITCSGLTAQLTTSAGVGSLISSFGSSAAQRIQFYDETISSSLGPYLNFNAGNPAQIRSTGNMQFWPAARTSSLLTLTSSQILLPTFANNSMLTISSAGNFLNGTLLMNGQLMIGSTSAAPVAANITGTANRVTVTNGAGSITLSGPQDIATTSTPTFAGAFLNGTTVIGSNALINTGVPKLMLYGTDSSSNGPHVAVYTSADIYPIFQQLNFSHNNISLNFDSYYDTAWRSCSTSSNYQIYKLNDIFSINYNNGGTLGSPIVNLPNNRAIAIINTGQVCVGGVPTNIGAYKSMIYGTANSSSASAGAHFQIVTSTDNYPIYHIAGNNHDSITQTFDGYFDGTTYRCSSTNGLFQIVKAANRLNFNSSPGGTQGTIPSISTAGYFDTSGNFTLNNLLYLPSQPLLMLSASTYQTISNTTDTDFATWDTSIRSQGGITITSNKTITVPVTGVYSITFQIGYDSTTGTLANYIYKNGTNPPRYGGATFYSGGGGQPSIIPSSTLMFLLAGDSLIVGVWQGSGANLHVGSINSYYTSYFNIVRLF